MKNCVTKFQHQNKKNRTVILIFPRYRTYLFICCFIYLNIWWHCVQCTKNWRIPWNDLWFRTARMAQQNNIKKKSKTCVLISMTYKKHNFRIIEISYSHMTIAMKKTLWWPQTKEVTIITVLIKKWPISQNFFNKV